MGVVVGWTQRETLTTVVWAAVCADVQRVLDAYPTELARQYREDRARRSWALAWLTPQAPSPPYALGLDGLGFSSEAIEICAPLGRGRTPGREITPETQDWSSWRVTREAGDGWCNPQLGWHDALLLATLGIVETHAPGTVVVTQNDYDNDDGRMQTELRAWVEPAIGRAMAWPARDNDDN